MRIRMTALSLVATVAFNLPAAQPMRLAVENKVPAPAAFEPLDMSLTIFDDQTARDLYGKKMAAGFYVVRLRFKNNLADQPRSVAGTSILLFSESMEVGVTLEKRRRKNDVWQPVDERELTQSVQPGSFSPFPKEVTEPPAEADAPTPSSTATAPDSPPCAGAVSYRPLTLEMVLSSFDAQSGGSSRSRNEQRKNIVSHTINPIEEVPFGSDLSRVVFFPKRPFRGMIADHEVRIAQICPYESRIQVATLNGRDRRTVVKSAPE